MADIVIDNWGSVFGLCPETARGLGWLNEHLPDAQRLGVNVYCEHRYVRSIIEAARAAGLELRAGG